MKISVRTKVCLLVALILVIDQIVKIWIKTHMVLGQEYNVFGDWFIIHFTENRGMAFGMELGGLSGKLFLTFFRIAAVTCIGLWIRHLIKRGFREGFILNVAAIMAGAIGNIIDSIFYGVIFSDSHSSLAKLFPAGGGYSGFFQGEVVDMFYFPIIHGQYPSWFPLIGSRDFIFFSPVFNVADAAISLGVFFLLIFFHRELTDKSTLD